MFLQYNSKNVVTFDPREKCHLNICNRSAKKKLSQLYLIHIIAQRVEASQVKDCTDCISSANVCSDSNTDHSLEQDDYLKPKGDEHPLLKKNSMINMITPFYYGNSTNDLLREVRLDQKNITNSCYSSSSSTYLMSHRVDFIKSDLAIQLGKPENDLFPWSKIHETQCLNNIRRGYQKSKNFKRAESTENSSKTENVEDRFVKIDAYSVDNKVKDILGLDQSRTTPENKLEDPDLGSKSTDETSQNETAQQVASQDWKTTVTQQASAQGINPMVMEPASDSSVNETASGVQQTTPSIAQSSSSSTSAAGKKGTTSSNESITKEQSTAIGRKSIVEMTPNLSSCSCDNTLPITVNADSGIDIRTENNACGGVSSIDITIDYKMNPACSSGSNMEATVIGKNIKKKNDAQRKNTDNLSKRLKLDEQIRKHENKDDRKKEKAAAHQWDKQQPMDHNKRKQSSKKNEIEQDDSCESRLAKEFNEVVNKKSREIYNKTKYKTTEHDEDCNDIMEKDHIRKNIQKSDYKPRKVANEKYKDIDCDDDNVSTIKKENQITHKNFQDVEEQRHENKKGEKEHLTQMPHDRHIQKSTKRVKKHFSDDDDDDFTIRNPENIPRRKTDLKIRKHDSDDDELLKRQEDSMQKKSYNASENYSSDQDKYFEKPEEKPRRPHESIHYDEHYKNESSRSRNTDGDDDQYPWHDKPEMKQGQDYPAQKFKHESSRMKRENGEPIIQNRKKNDISKDLVDLEQLTAGFDSLCGDERMENLKSKHKKLRNENELNNMRYKKETISKNCIDKLQDDNFFEQNSSDIISKTNYRPVDNVHQHHLRVKDLHEKSNEYLRDEFQMNSENEDEENKSTKHMPRKVDRDINKSQNKQRQNRQHNHPKSQTYWSDDNQSVNMQKADINQEQNKITHKKLKSKPKENLNIDQDIVQHKTKKASKNKHDEVYEESLETVRKHSKSNNKNQGRQNEKFSESKEPNDQAFDSDDNLEDVNEAKKLIQENHNSRNSTFEANPITIENSEIKSSPKDKKRLKESCISKSRGDNDTKRTAKKERLRSHKKEKSFLQQRSREKMNEAQKKTNIDETEEENKEKRRLRNRNENIIQTKRKSIFNEDQNVSLGSSDESDSFKTQEIRMHTHQLNYRKGKSDKSKTEDTSEEPQRYPRRSKDRKIKSESNEILDEENSSDDSLEENSKNHKRKPNETHMNRKEKLSVKKHRNHSPAEQDIDSEEDSNEKLKRKVKKISRHLHNTEAHDFDDNDFEEEGEKTRKQIKPFEKNRSKDTSRTGRKSSKRLDNTEAEDGKKRHEKNKENIREIQKRNLQSNKNNIELQDDDTTYAHENKSRNLNKHRLYEDRVKSRRSTPDKYNSPKKHSNIKEKDCNEGDEELCDAFEMFLKSNRQSKESEQNDQQEDLEECDNDSKSEYYDNDSITTDNEQSERSTWKAYRTGLVENIYHEATYRLNPTIEMVNIKTHDKSSCKSGTKRDKDWKVTNYKEKKDECDKKGMKDEEDSIDSDCDPPTPNSQKYIQSPLTNTTPNESETPESDCLWNSDDDRFMKYNEEKERIKRKFQKECAKKKALSEKYKIKCKYEQCESEDSISGSEININCNEAKVSYDKSNKQKYSLDSDSEKNIYILEQAPKNDCDFKRKPNQATDDDESCAKDKNFSFCKEKLKKPCKPAKDSNAEISSESGTGSDYKCTNVIRDYDIPEFGYFFKDGNLYKDGKLFAEGVTIRNGQFRKGRRVLLEGITLKDGIFYKGDQPVGESEPGNYRKQFLDDNDPYTRKKYVNPLVDPDITPIRSRAGRKRDKSKNNHVEYPISGSGSSIAYRAKTSVYPHALRKYRSRQKYSDEDFESLDSLSSKISSKNSSEIIVKTKHKKKKYKEGNVKTEETDSGNEIKKGQKHKKEEKNKEKDIKENKKNKEKNAKEKKGTLKTEKRKTEKDTKLAENRKIIAEKCLAIEKELAEREKLANAAARRRPIKSGILLKIDPPCDECMVEPVTGDIVLTKVLKSWIGPLYSPNMPC